MFGAVNRNLDANTEPFLRRAAYTSLLQDSIDSRRIAGS